MEEDLYIDGLFRFRSHLRLILSAIRMVTYLTRCVPSLSVKVKQQEELLGKCRDNIQQNVSRSAALSAENERLRSQLADSQVRAVYDQCVPAGTGLCTAPAAMGGGKACDGGQLLWEMVVPATAS